MNSPFDTLQGITSPFGVAIGGGSPALPTDGLVLHYDPADISTLFQDSAGTTPVTADGDPVARINDVTGSGVNLDDPINDAGRPTYRTDGTLHWLELDGVDDSLSNFGWSGVKPVNAHVFIGASSGPSAFMLFNSNNGLFMGTGENGNGNPHYTGLTLGSTIVDGVSIGSTRGDLYSAVEPNDGHVVEFAGADMSAWQNLTVGRYSASGFRLQGNIYQIAIYDNPTPETIAAARAYMAAKSGVTL